MAIHDGTAKLARLARASVIMMNVLFVAALPPPISGQSKASGTIFDELVRLGHSVVPVNLNKQSLVSGNFTLTRLFEILSVAKQIRRKRKQADVLYLSLAESTLGNLRDLLFVALLRKSPTRVVVHILGGSRLRSIVSGNGWLARLNKGVMKRADAAIVEGPVNSGIFSNSLRPDQIFVVENSAEDYLFSNKQEIESKYNDLTTLSILYLSNLLTGKGYLELTQAAIALQSEMANRVVFRFVGGFESKDAEDQFHALVNGYPNIEYLGSFIDGEEKKKLYLNSHIFCLPTYYPYEGQPISILEAYATGCVVITTAHSGIPFVFSDSTNGFLVEPKSTSSIVDAIRRAASDPKLLVEIAQRNFEQASERNTPKLFRDRIVNVLTSETSESGRLQK
jgi:glycosyltransferase involved in cell wall biosynthesis